MCELTVNDLADGAVLTQVVVISLRRPGYLGKRLLFVMSLSALSFQRTLFFKIGQSGQVLFIFQDSLSSFFFPPFEAGSHKPQTLSVAKDGLELQVLSLYLPKGGVTAMCH